MSFDTVYAGIVGRLNALGYAESSDVTDFKNASSEEYGNTFILKCVSGEMGLENKSNGFDDAQEWQVRIAFKRNDQSEVIALQETHRKKDAILADLDNPVRWESFVKMLKYKSWTVIETPNYFILDVRLHVLDTYTY